MKSETLPTTFLPKFLSPKSTTVRLLKFPSRKKGHTFSSTYISKPPCTYIPSAVLITDTKGITVLHLVFTYWNILDMSPQCHIRIHCILSDGYILFSGLDLYHVLLPPVGFCTTRWWFSCSLLLQTKPQCLLPNFLKGPVISAQDFPTGQKGCAQGPRK